MGTGSFPGVKSGRGVTLTPHPLLVPWLRKSRSIPLLLLWAVWPVQSLGACTRVHFTIFYTQKGNNNNKKLLAYTALVRPILDYRAVCWDPYREGQVSALNRVQKRAAKFGNNINETGWAIMAQRTLIARIRALFKANTGGRAWKAIGDRLLKPCCLSRDDHNRKIRTWKQITDVGNHSYVNRNIKSWNQITCRLTSVFLPYKLNKFRKRVKNVVTGKGIVVGIECK